MRRKVTTTWEPPEGWDLVAPGIWEREVPAWCGPVVMRLARHPDGSGWEVTAHGLPRLGMRLLVSGAPDGDEAIRRARGVWASEVAPAREGS